MDHEPKIDRIQNMHHNLTNHTPKSQFMIIDIEALREVAKGFGAEIIRRTPTSREQSLALTNLEQTLMWAVAAIARHQEE